MPPEFYKHIAKLKRQSMAETVCSLMFVVATVAAISVWRYRPQLAIFFSILAVISILVIFVRVRQSQHTPKVGSPYRIPIQKRTIDEITAALAAENLDEDTYFSRISYNGFSIRCLIQFLPVFTATAAKNNRRNANRKINKKYPTPTEVSIFDGYKMLRINLLVCQSENRELTAWIRKDADQLLCRVEGIINIAIVLQNGTLLIPPLANVSFGTSIKKYVSAIELFVARFAA